MIIIFLGPPGSGKGTQATDVAKQFGLKTLSTGDLLRVEIAAETKLGKKIQEVVNSGRLVNDEIVLDLIERNLDKYSGARGVILDGFPRTIVQAKKLNERLEATGRIVNFVFELDVDQDLLIKRLTNRYQCANCGTNYNKLYKNPSKPGICDVCGSHEFKMREDDTKSVILERFKEYHDLTEPLLPYYNSQGVLYRIDGNQTPDKIFAEISNILKNVLT